MPHPNPCPTCPERLGARYGRSQVCWLCWLRTHPQPRRRPRRESVSDYTRFVRRVRQAIETRTGSPVGYLDARHGGCYCPACRDGILRIAFLDHPRPGFTIDSPNHGPGRCSRGCSEQEVANAIA